MAKADMQPMSMPANVLIPPAFDTIVRETVLGELIELGVPPGAVVLIPLKSLDAEWGDISRAVPIMRELLPSVPFGVLYTGLERIGTRIAVRAASQGIRLVLERRTIRAQAVRDQLTDPDLLAEYGAHWLQQMRILPDPEASALFVQICKMARTSSSLAEMERKEGFNLHRAWRLLRALNLRPVDLLSLARRSYQAMELQRTNETIGRFAARLGYQNPSSISEALSETFRVPASTIRLWAGFEPLFARYFIERPEVNRAGGEVPVRRGPVRLNVNRAAAGRVLLESVSAVVAGSDSAVAS